MLNSLAMLTNNVIVDTPCCRRIVNERTTLESLFKSTISFSSDEALICRRVLTLCACRIHSNYALGAM